MEIIHHHPMQANDKTRSDLLKKLHQCCVSRLREEHRIFPRSTEVRGR